jgi:5-methylcytosine-specific restriction endonuclease McrA
MVGVFWKLEHCSNEHLLAKLDSLVRSCRQQTAEIVAHLAEVETRRLHLELAHGSLFDYCVRRLGLSEDEACRRIDVARLARRFPALFPLLASGEISLSLAAALKPYLVEGNASEVFASVRGKTTQQAREALAALLPRADVAPSVRKLPERRLAPARVAAAPELPSLASATGNVPSAPSPSAIFTPQAPSAPEPRERKPTSTIEPLSSARYRVQFTAGVALKDKLDQARDLMRHRNPSGDLGIVVDRALDLLLEQLMKERFGATNKPRPSKNENTARVNNATRRAVFERDGLQCSWVDARGQRCESRAWLELDHRDPRGKGGGSGLENIRVLCRSHNRLAAEHEYGRQAIETVIAERRKSATRPADPGVEPHAT